MKENPILVIVPRLVDLLVPDDAARGVGRDVDELEEEGVPDQVVGEDDGAGEAGGRPLARGRGGDVEFGDGDGVDLVGLLGHAAFDCLLVRVGEDRGHFDDYYCCDSL